MKYFSTLISIIALIGLAGCGWSKGSIEGDATSTTPSQISFETKADGSGQKLTQVNLTDSMQKTIYAINRDTNGNFVGPLSGSWSVQGTNATVQGSNTGASVVLKGQTAGVTTLSFSATSATSATTATTASQQSPISVEASPTMNFKTSAATISEYGFIEFELLLDHAVQTDLEVNLSTPTGTAIAGTDYVAPPSVITVPAGTTSYKFFAPVIRNFVKNATKALSVSMSAANGGVIGSTLTTNISITDSDPSTTLITGAPGTIALGDEYTCWIKNSGLYCWGKNTEGQIGNGTTSAMVNTPYLVFPEGSGVTWVAAKRYSTVLSAESHTCAVVAGAAKCWGNNNYGQLGIGNYVNKSSPQAVSGMASGVTQISVGDVSTCAIQSGALKCWGDGGDIKGDFVSNYPTPYAFANFTSGVTRVTSGGQNHMIIHNGAAKSWGGFDVNGVSFAINFPGQINPTEPQQVYGVTTGATEITMQDYGGCVLVSGAMSCWGYHVNYTLDAPTLTPGFSSNVTHMAMRGTYGDQVACASFVDGHVSCYVFGGSMGTSTYNIENVLIAGATIVSIVSGGRSMCAIYDTGDSRCWSLESGPGALITAQKSLPTYTVTNIEMDSITSSGCGLKNKRVYCAANSDPNQMTEQTQLGLFDKIWGDASSGCGTINGALKCWGSGTLLGDGVNLATTTPVDVVGLSSGVTHLAFAYDYTNPTRCALKNNEVYCWSSNQLPTLLSGFPSPVVSLTASNFVIAAVLQNGEVRTWVANLTISSYAGPPSNVKQVALYSGFWGHSCFLHNDETITCMGNNTYGQLGDGTTTNKATPQTVPGLSGVKEIYAGSGYTCARTSTVLKCWGSSPAGSSLVPTDVGQIDMNNPKSVMASAQLCILNSKSQLACTGGNSAIYAPLPLSSRWAAPLPTP